MFLGDADIRGFIAHFAKKFAMSTFLGTVWARSLTGVTLIISCLT
jgi:hypothetical protein